LHYFEHSRDYLFQDVCLFADDFVCNLVRQRQDALQPIQQSRWNLVVFVLFLQELKDQELHLRFDTPVESTNLKCDSGNSEDGLCNRVELKGVKGFLDSIRES